MTDSSGKDAVAESSLQMELRYCPRCGALGVVPAGSFLGNCPACVHTLRWLGQEARDETADV